MPSVEAELQELRRRRRTRRIVIAVSCVAVLIVAAVWLSNRHSTMTCSDWQAEYSAALLYSGGSPESRTYGTGTKANLEQIRPEGCPIPSAPMPSGSSTSAVVTNRYSTH